MATIIDKLNHIKQTKSMLKSAINQKGGGLKETDSFRSYVSEVENLGDKTLDEFAWVEGYRDALVKSISHDWPDIMDIMYSHQGDDDPYYAVVFLFDDRKDDTSLGGFSHKVIEITTSDGGVYTEDLEDAITHTWDKLQDIDGKYRWAIVKYNEDFPKNSPIANEDAISVGVSRDYIELRKNNPAMFAGNLSVLLFQEMEGMEGANNSAIFSGCSSLVEVPSFVKTLQDVTNLNSVFSGGSFKIIEGVNSSVLYGVDSGGEETLILKNIKMTDQGMLGGYNIFPNLIYVENLVFTHPAGFMNPGVLASLGSKVEKIKGVSALGHTLNYVLSFGGGLRILEDFNFPNLTEFNELGLPDKSTLEIFNNFNAPVLEDIKGSFNGYTSLHTLTNIKIKNDAVFDDDSFRGCGKLINLSFSIEDPIRFSGLNLADSPLLSKKSVLDLFNQLDELWGENLGEVISLNTMTYFRLSEEELSIATDKGWVIEYKDSILEEESE